MSELLIEENKIIDLFDLLVSNDIEYVLLRNINEELPIKLPKNKDIDIIINPLQKDFFIKTLINSGWRQVPHPWDFGDNFVFLYSMDPFLFFKKDGLILDVCFQLSCRSLNKGEWFPLDECIQNSVWENKLFSNTLAWKFSLSNEDQLLHLITRCIFDKKKFTPEYIAEIEKYIEIVTIHDFKEKIEPVFFKFSDTLIEVLLLKEYEDIRTKYLKFSNY